MLRMGVTISITICSVAYAAQPATSTPLPDQANMYGWAARTPLAPSQTTKSALPETVSSADYEAVVVEAVEAKGFNTVYLRLDAGHRQFWIASQITEVRVGNRVRFATDQVVAMENFESKALKRNFEKIYFIPTISIAGNEKE
jgi:hypothetical protein